jgi:hypothetical protein
LLQLKKRLGNLEPMKSHYDMLNIWLKISWPQLGLMRSAPGKWRDTVPSTRRYFGEMQQELEARAYSRCSKTRAFENW